MSSFQSYRPSHAATAQEIAAQRHARQNAAAAPAPADATYPNTTPPGAVASQAPTPVAPPMVAEQPLPAVMSQTTGLHWPQYVNKHRLVGALIAGFAATHIADMFGYWMPMFGLPKLDFAFFNGLVLLPETAAMPQWLTGMMFHSLNGMVFALGYALVIFPFLGKTLTTGRNLARGLLMGMTLSTLSLAWWMPGNLPGVGIEPGTFSMNFGVSTVIAVYVWHLVWSLALGFFFNPQD